MLWVKYVNLSEKLCDPLTPPANGALVCDTWSAGKGTHCSMQCNGAWDIPRTAKPIDVFVCSTVDGVWKPYEKVPNCTGNVLVKMAHRQEAEIIFHVP